MNSSATGAAPPRATKQRPALRLKPTERHRALAAGKLKTAAPAPAPAPAPAQAARPRPPADPTPCATFTSAHAALAELLGAEPRLPLALGAREQAAARALECEQVIATLCRTDFYMWLLGRTGMHRWNLDGTDAGPVTDTHRMWARKNRFKLHKKAARAASSAAQTNQIELES